METISIKCSYEKMMDVDLIVEHPQNANSHPEKQIELLAKILKYQGWRQPLVVSKRSGLLVSGHGRLMAAKKAGVQQVPVSTQDFENEAQEIAHLFADNKIAMLAQHDDSMMIDTLKDLDMADFDFELLGMDNFDLPIDPDEAKEEIEDDIPENVDTRCKPGDLWILGEHRLLCGDSTNIQHVERLMGGEKADMVFTDPPFPNNSEIMHEMIENIEGAFVNARMVCQGLMMWFWDNLQTPPFQEQITSKHIWHKTNGWQAGHFESVYCYHGDSKRHEQVVFSETSVGGADVRKDQGNHPTPKPVKLPLAIFEKFKFGKVVLDLFGGSGTTLIACEKTNRKCYMMELDPHYCDVILTRWEKYSGKVAELKPN